MTTFDEQTNNDLPGEIHEWTEDPADRQYHDQIVAGDEDWREWDGEEDDSWDDGDSLASCGWGEDEAYGFFGEDC